MSDSTIASTTAGKPQGVGWGWLLAAGVFTTLISLFMFVYPAAASVAVTLFVGWSLLLAGVLGFVSGIVNRAAGGMWANIVLGLLSVAAGYFLAFNPLHGTVTLTMVFLFWLLADGVLGIVLSLSRRGHGWGWWFVSSLISLVLAFVLLGSMPLASIWILGLFAAITLLFRGMMLTTIAFEVRRLGSAG